MGSCRICGQDCKKYFCSSDCYDEGKKTFEYPDYKKPLPYKKDKSYRRFQKIHDNMQSRWKRQKSYDGILVCKRWKKFKNFYADMYESYLKHSREHGEKNTSIDRINGKKGYSPKNCRWATRLTQNNNKSVCTYLTYKGRTMTLSMWAREIGIGQSGMWNRIFSRKWSIEKAIETPVRKVKKGLE